MNLNICVVLYGTLPSKSNALKGIFSADLSPLAHAHITIWNNGPTLISDEEIQVLHHSATTLDVPITLYNTTGNFSLAKIFNFFTEQKPYSHFLILDSDSTIDASFFINLAAAEKYDLILPIIYEEYSQAYTWPRKVITSSNTIPLTTEGECMASALEFPNSGTCLSYNFIQLFKQHYPATFNEAFGIYGVDVYFHTAVSHLRGMGLKFSIFLTNHMRHQFSLFNKKADPIAATRSVELACETALVRLHVRQKSRISTLNFFFKKYARKLNSKQFFAYLYCVATKRHPRNTPTQNKNFEQAIATPIKIQP